MAVSLVSVIIVNWNGRTWLRRCLESLATWVTYPHQVIVVDNASTDGSVDMLRQDFPHVELIVNPINHGYARANNQGLSRSTGEFVVFLNNDVEFVAEPFQALIDVCRHDHHVGCAAPELLNPDRSHQPSVRLFPYWTDQVLTLLKLRKILGWTPMLRKYMADPGAGQTKALAVDQVMGAAILLPRHVLDEIGGWDEGYWIWFEEVDLCQRLHRAGYSVMYVPGAKILHHGNQSFRQVISLKKHRWFLRSLRRYTKKYWTPLAAGSLAIFMPISYLLTVLQSVIKPR